MKKAIFTAIFLTSFVFVSPAFAQVASTTPSLQDQYHSTLITLINLLEQEVQALTAQLQTVLAQQTTIQNNQTTMQSQVNTIVQNTTPVFGNVPQTSDQSGIFVINQTFFPHGGGAQFGQWSFEVKVLDKNGKSINQPVAMIAPDIMNGNTNEDNGEDGGLSYVPADANYPKTITFTSGNLSTTTTITTQ